MTSIVKTPALAENTLSPNAPNIATTDENLSVDDMFQQTSLPSLGKQIFPVQTMDGPTAAIFNVRKNALGDIELLRKEVIVGNSTSIPSGLSQEAVHDIKAQYSKDANNLIGNLLRGVANEEENLTTIAFLETNSLLDLPLQLTNSKNAETNLFEITQRVHELILKINLIASRSFESYAVVPYKALSSIMGLKDYVNADILEDSDIKGLFVAKIGLTKYYLNPDPLATTVYVGINDQQNPSKSSAVFSPYRSTIVEAVSHITGNSSFNIFNRYAITASPLHIPGEEMMHKFVVLL